MRSLHWDATYEIVLSLKAAYPDVDLDTLGLDQLYHYIVSLPDFSDDPEMATDGMLAEILREWYEEVNEL